MKRFHLTNSSGFTLIELLLVVVILSMVAFMSLAAVENGSDQVRYEDTRNRLGLVRTGIVGERGPAFNGQRLLSGYVADNGLLPLNINGLTTQPASYDGFASIFPVFDSDPDANGINDATNTSSPTGDAHRLFKGYRGSYLLLPAGVTAFLDGWGNAWTETPTVTTFTSTSPGKNNIVNPADVDYERDIPDTITVDDWRIDAGGWQITVTNSSGSDLTVTGSQCYRVSLLVYINDADQANNFNWKRLTSECISGNVVNNTSYVLTFPVTGGGTGSYQPDTNIPQGEHLLVLVNDSDGTDAHNDTSESMYDSDTVTAGIQAVSAHVNFYTRAARPTTELVIR